MEATLLSENQIFGDNKLEILKKYGLRAQMTDFAILLGGLADLFDIDKDICSGFYSTKSFDKLGRISIADFGGKVPFFNHDRHIGIRPTINFSSIKHNFKYDIVNDEYNMLEVKFGNYPKNAALYSTQKEIEEKFINFTGKELYLTDDTYTTDSRKCDEQYLDFLPLTHYEYEYKGKRYIRVIANSCYNFNKLLLSNGGLYKNGDVVWVEVEPLKWLVDKQSDLMITKEIVLAGIQFQYNKLENSEFEDTDMYKFLNTYFVKNIMQSINRKLEVKVEYEKSKQEIELENIQKTKQKILKLKKKY